MTSARIVIDIGDGFVWRIEFRESDDEDWLVVDAGREQTLGRALRAVGAAASTRSV